MGSPEALSRRRFLVVAGSASAGLMLQSCGGGGSGRQDGAAAGTPARLATVDQMPSSFKEAPMLAPLVEAGKLPPVDERLPAEPLVLRPLGKVGVYGGTLRQAFAGTGDELAFARLMHDHLLYWDLEVTEVVPNIVKAFKQSGDGRECTLQLREGMRWSDGEPFTSADLVFWWNDVLRDDRLSASKPPWAAPQGKLGEVEAVDEHTVRYRWPVPNALFPQLIASSVAGGHFDRGGQGLGMFSPAHYMKQFHAEYADARKLEKAVKASSLPDWQSLFLMKNSPMQNSDAPTTAPWKPLRTLSARQVVLERNPYYFGVDTDGNQLPYIDRIEASLVTDPEAGTLAASAGKFDFHWRYVKLEDFPVYRRNEQRGNYRVLRWRVPWGTDAGLYCNQSYEEDKELARWLRSREFRYALSMGIDRDQLNETFWLGLGKPGSAAPGEESQYYLGPESRTQNATLDAERANELLDGLGLRKGGDGLRQRSDGKGPLVVPIATTAAQFVPATDIAQMIADQLQKNIGVKVRVDEYEQNRRWDLLASNKLPVVLWQNDGSDDPLLTPVNTIAYTRYSSTAPAMGLWVESRGKEGMRPPGNLKKVADLLQQASAEPSARRQKEIAKEILRIAFVEEMWCIGTVGLAPAIVLASNKLQNVPEVVVYSETAYAPGNAHPEQFFFSA